MDAASNHRKDIMTEPVALSVSKQKHSRSIARAKRKKQKHSKTKGMNVHKQTVKKRIDKAKSSATSCKKTRDKIKIWSNWQSEKSQIIAANSFNAAHAEKPG